MPRSKLIYLIFTLMFFILLAYLGIRTLEHEVLLRQYQTQTLARTQTANVAAGIENLLQQKASASACYQRFYRSPEFRRSQDAKRTR